MLKGEGLVAAEVLIPLAVCVGLTVLCVGFVARALRAAAVR